MEQILRLEATAEKELTQMDRVLVTGANGFIGNALTLFLSEKEFDVYALERYVSNRYNVPSNPKVKTVFADLTDYLAINSLVRQIKPEIIIHLAALTAVATSYDRWQEYLETNFNATVNLAETALRHDPNLKQFVMAGTSECYGNQDSVSRLTERAGYCPNSPYAVSKVAAINYLKYMWEAYRFPVTIMLPFNSYGRSNCRHFIVEHIISQMLTQKTVRLGDPEPVRDFLYVDDHVEGYFSVLNNKDALGETFNLCTGVGTSIRQLAEKTGVLTGYEGEIIWNTIPTRPLDIQNLVGDNTKATLRLRWEPKVSLDEGLKRTVKLLRNDKH